MTTGTAVAESNTNALVPLRRAVVTEANPKPTGGITGASGTTSDYNRIQNAPRRQQATAKIAADFPAAEERHVDGVLERSDGEICVIRVNMATGRVDIPLPSALVPAELRVIGQPLRISLDRSSGVRQPRIEGVAMTNVLSDEEREMLEWANSL